MKVLLVEDDEDDFIITREYLNKISSRSFHLDHISDFDQARDVMSRCAHDIYLVDYRLGPHNGMELLKEAVERDCPSPVILLTGLGDREIDVEAMKAGAADYLIKGQINAAMLERSINHSLQRKEAERKLRASEERLRLSQKLESVGTLAGGIAHDFNNILTIIAVFANRLREPTLPAEQKGQMIDSIDETVKRGAALVKQLLTFARQTEVQFERVQINDVIRGWMTMLQETFPKSVRFSSSLSDSLPAILADVTQLHQILLNLCVNARDAMNGRGLIRITTRLGSGAALREKDVQAPSERYVCLEVSDTGCGMDAATQKRIFDPFFTTKDKEHGTGLGLAIVYGIVRTHHGHIELESAPGAGATFRIFLPATLTIANGAHST